MCIFRSQYHTQLPFDHHTQQSTMMANMILRTVLGMGVLVELLPKTVAGEHSGVGANVAGSTLIIPTQTPVPFNQTCALDTYLFNQTDLGVYCNGKQLFETVINKALIQNITGDNRTIWGFDWTW